MLHCKLTHYVDISKFIYFIELQIAYSKKMKKKKDGRVVVRTTILRGLSSYFGCIVPYHSLGGKEADWMLFLCTLLLAMLSCRPLELLYESNTVQTRTS